MDSDTAFLWLGVLVCICLCTWQTFLSGRQTGSGIDGFKVTCPAGTGCFLSPQPFEVQVDKTQFSGSHQKGFKRLQSPFLGTSDRPSKAGWGRGMCGDLCRDGQAVLQKQVCRPHRPQNGLCVTVGTRSASQSLWKQTALLPLLPEVTLTSP